MDNHLLQPGDIIHLAWPVTQSGDAGAADEIIALYAAFGVTVSMVSFVSSPALPGPYVISIIRKPYVRITLPNLPEEI